MTRLDQDRARAAVAAYAVGVDELLDRLMCDLVGAGLPISRAQRIAIELAGWNVPGTTERVEALLLGAEDKEAAT